MTRKADKRRIKARKVALRHEIFAVQMAGHGLPLEAVRTGGKKLRNSILGSVAWQQAQPPSAEEVAAKERAVDLVIRNHSRSKA